MDSIVYRGEIFWLQSSGRYYQSGLRKGRTRSLHRRIYEDAFGSIPKGYCVHHINGDWKDNRLENLKCVPLREHQRDHMLERLKDPTFKQKLTANVIAAQDKAKIWHGSRAGIAWHKKHGIASWKKRAEHSCVCCVCGSGFLSPVRKTRFCSRSCFQKQGYQKHKTLEGACKLCGAKFLHNKYRVQEFCSRSCSNRSRNGLPPKLNF